jgi:hypothetical protein
MNQSELEFQLFNKTHFETTSSLIDDIRKKAKELGRENEFEGFSWIKVKAFKFDENISFEENLEKLRLHHINETLFLTNKLKELEGLK